MTIVAKKWAFIREYFKDFKPIDAAVRAGYSQTYASNNASRILKEPEIAAVVQEELDRLAARMSISTERTLEEYARMAYVDPRKFYDADGNLKSIADLDEATAAALCGFDVNEKVLGDGIVTRTKKIKLEKIKALDSISKYLGIFEKHNRQLAINIHPPSIDKPPDSGQ